MDTSPTTCRTLEQYYHVNSNTLDKQYKDVLSDYRTWSEIEHADEWLVFPDNIGRNLAIDETSMSNGELHTIVTNRDRHGKDQCLVAIVKGVKSEDVIQNRSLGFLFAVRHREILMTDLGLMQKSKLSEHH